MCLSEVRPEQLDKRRVGGLARLQWQQVGVGECECEDRAGRLLRIEDIRLKRPEQTARVFQGTRADDKGGASRFALAIEIAWCLVTAAGGLQAAQPI